MAELVPAHGVRPEHTFLRICCPHGRAAPWPGPVGAAGSKSHQHFTGAAFQCHLPDFLQQTALQSWVPPLQQGRPEATGWLPSETHREKALPAWHRGTGLGRFVYRLLLLRKLLSVTVILAQMSNKYAPT